MFYRRCCITVQSKKIREKSPFLEIGEQFMEDWAFKTSPNEDSS